MFFIFESDGGWGGGGEGDVFCNDRIFIRFFIILF